MTQIQTGGPRATVFPSPPDKDEILVREIAEILQAAGIKAWQPAFPFLLHHRHYRHLGTRRGGKNYRRDEIGAELRRWAASRGDPTDYVWQAVCGALAEMESATKDIRDQIPDEIRRRLEDIRWGEEFAEWISGAGGHAVSSSKLSEGSSESGSTPEV